MICALSVVGVAMLSGCTAFSLGPVPALITLDQKGPVAVGPATELGSKVGTSEAKGILVYSTGDASIKAAMENGGISRIHHVDNETMNILGVYAVYRTIVYGD
jgi:hypothetical protein